MSPRPRKVSDDDVLAAAQRAMATLGPGELTLAQIAREAGVTAGALAQRFGSKRAILLALAERAADGTGDFVRGLRAEHGSPIATVRAYAACMAHLAQSPAALARNLAYLQIDLADPDFRTHLAAQATATRAAIADLLADAVADGELAPATDLATLARTVEITLNGALLTWAFDQREPAAAFLRSAVDAVLAPHLTSTTQR